MACGQDGMAGRLLLSGAADQLARCGLEPGQGVLEFVAHVPLRRSAECFVRRLRQLAQRAP